MRVSELLGTPVIDAAGERVGVVQDLRAGREIETGRLGTRGRFPVIGLVAGGDGLRDRMAHGWGFAEDRARGPWIARRLVTGAVAESTFVPASDVASWGPGKVRLAVMRSELVALQEALEHE